MKKDKYGEICVWCGFPLLINEGNSSMLRWRVLVHEHCAEDYHENQSLEKLTPEGMYPLEDGWHIDQSMFGGMGPRPAPLSAKNQKNENNRRKFEDIVHLKRGTMFNTNTNRYEYYDGTPVSTECNLPKKEGLPWDDNKKTPDGSSVMSGWGEKSSWGNPRPLG